MKTTNFENYHSLKLIEALTSIIESRDISRTEVDYLKHTLTFIPWNNDIADAWIEVLNMINRYLEQLEEYSDQQQELLNFLLEFDNTKQRFEILEIIIGNEFHNNQFQQAMEYVNQQLDIAELESNEQLINRAYRTKGVIYQVLGQLDKADQWYKEAYDLLETIDSEKLNNQTIYSLANLYQHYLANYGKARELYQEAYELAVSTENEERQAFYLDHMAMADYEIGNYEQAIESHDHAWEILKHQGKSINVLFHKVQLSLALAELSQIERVGDELHSIIELKKQNDDPYSNCWYLLLLSEFSQKRPDNYSKLKDSFANQLGIKMEPLALAREASKISRQTRHVPSMINSNLYLAKYSMEDDPTGAIGLLSEAKQLAEQNNRNREIERIRSWVQSFGLDYDTI